MGKEIGRLTGVSSFFRLSDRNRRGFPDRSHKRLTQKERFTTEDTEGTEDKKRGRDRSIDNSTTKRRLVDITSFFSSSSVSSVSSVVSLFLLFVLRLDPAEAGRAAGYRWQ
jgi:hypothetical protein